jgi:GT2 family glycosyltransferase
MNKVVSIVIPVYNKWNFTKSCLNDLVRLSSNHEIIIIDNASTDETNVELNKLADELFQKNPTGCGIGYVQNKENTFHSKACNQGFRIAVGEYVIFLNNDIRVKSNHENWTKTLIDACDSTNGIVGPTMGQLDREMNFVREANEQLTGNSYIGGWCIAAKKDIWQNLGQKGPWNEEFPFYFNDTDLSFRARLDNIPLTCIKMSDVVHFGKVSAAQINIPKLYNEGRTVFLKKWGSKK